MQKKKKKKKDANGSKLVVIDYFSYPGLVAQMSQKDIAKSTKFVLPQMTALSSRELCWCTTDLVLSNK